MKNIIKLLAVSFVGVSLMSCEKTNLADPALQGSWDMTFVKDFVLDIPNAASFKNLCTPGNTVELNFAGVGQSRFSGNRSALNENMYIRLGDRANNSTPNTTLASSSFYIDCNDITVSSIEHRDIYITGQPGYISKQMIDGKCVLKSDRERTRPKYTVFVRLTGSRSRINSEGNSEFDDSNRLAGATYDCDDGRLTNVSRVANKNKGDAKEVPLVNSKETLQILKNNRSILSNTEIFK